MLFYCNIFISSLLRLQTKNLISMCYYFSKVVKNTSFEEAIEKVTVELGKEGFGVLSENNVGETLRTKLNINFKKYMILGACNPQFAYKAISSEDKIGVFLPCNVVVEENDNGEIEVFAVDPAASMMAVKNESLGELATEVRQKLARVIENLG